MATMFNREHHVLNLLDTENIFDIPPQFLASKKPIHVIMITHHFLDMIKTSISCMNAILAKRDDVHVIILDSGSDPEIQAYLKTLKPTSYEIHYAENLGKARLTNNYCHRVYELSSTPEIVISMDPDIVISPHDFDQFVDALRDVERVGVLGMRYTQNLCNPEVRLLFKPRKLKGKSGKIYAINKPFLCNVAGPFIGIRGSVLISDLHYRYFPVKRYAKYCPDEGPLHDALKWKYLNGYLEGTCITHLKSGDILCAPPS
jgi:GT2 family glycosyltransferase